MYVFTPLVVATDASAVYPFRFADDVIPADVKNVAYVASPIRAASAFFAVTVITAFSPAVYSALSNDYATDAIPVLTTLSV